MPHLKFSKDLSTISEFASRQASGTAKRRPIAFHALNGMSYAEAFRSYGFGVADAMHRPGFAGVVGMCKNMPLFLMPWSGPDYLALYEEAAALIEEIDPLVDLSSNK